jgi:hypothetical protein
MFAKNHVRSHPDTTHPSTIPDILPPSLGVPGNLWTEIPYYTVYRFNPTLDIPPQIAVNKQWRYVEVGQFMFLDVDVQLQTNACVWFWLITKTTVSNKNYIHDKRVSSNA